MFLRENLTWGMLYQLWRTVPKTKRVSFGFQKISWFLTNMIFTSIPIDILFMSLVHTLQTPKTTFLFFFTLFGFHNPAFVYLTASGTRIWRNYKQCMPLLLYEDHRNLPWLLSPKKKKAIKHLLVSRAKKWASVGYGVSRWFYQGNRCYFPIILQSIDSVLAYT